jgi:anaerobic selenocysteine-containing dehydrogenase
LAKEESNIGTGMRLIGRRQLRSNNSWMHNVPSLMKGRPRCTLLMHPTDAERLGLSTGDEAQIETDVGEARVPVVVSDEIMPGVVSLPHGFGHRRKGTRLRVAEEHAGVSLNDLTNPALIDALTGNAVLNGVPVRVSAPH